MILAVSIVSHGHGEQLRRLIDLLAQSPIGILGRVWVTLNIHEPGLAEWLISQASAHEGPSTSVLDIRVIQNSKPQGFGQNHNQAFARELELAAPAPWFCVLNPDVFWRDNPFAAMMALAAVENVGCIYPLQVTSEGASQDHQRSLITPSALLRRRILRIKETDLSVDWVCGAFMLLRSTAFRQVGGFDERYHLYCEDVDLCLRLQMNEHTLALASGATIVHDAHRNSLNHPRHFVWHVRSLLRLWCSSSYRRYRNWRANQAAAGHLK